MKRDDGHRVQRLIMVATSAIIISIGLLITTTVSADESPALVANDADPRVERTSHRGLTGCNPAGRWPLPLSVCPEWRQLPHPPEKISRTILSKDSTKKCFGSTAKFSIATC